MYQQQHSNKRLVAFLTFWLGCWGIMWSFDPLVYQQIRQQVSNGDVDAGMLRLEKQIKKEKKEAQWYWLLDDIYKSQRLTTQRIECLQRALKEKKLTQRNATIIRLAQAFFDNGNYDKAQALYHTLPASLPKEKWIKGCHIADSLRKHPIAVTLQSMGDSINMPYDNIWPSLTADAQWFCSTVVLGKRGFVGNTMQLQEDIYISKKVNGVWQPIEALSYPINTESNEGSQSFSADGNYLFLARCNEQGGMGSCDIYYCIKRNNKWSAPILAPVPLNSKYWESTPALSASGKEMYFSSNRPGGKGGKDIWQCKVTQQKDGRLSFSSPVPISDAINTSGDELSPFLHTNDSTLYFVSNGHYGMGGLDIFCSKRQKNGTWSTPQNMGYPINTYGDEMGWFVSPNGETAYLSSDHQQQDAIHKIIYRIELPENMRPTPAKPMQIWQIGTPYQLENIYFDFNKATLNDASYTELNHLVATMKTYPQLRFTISGHTDNVGNEAYNLQLSQQRADSVVHYLIQHGVEPSRLQSQGMGSSRPIESNQTEWGRAQNRRIEISLWQ